MNSRVTKKQNKRLKVAIRELNNDVAADLGDEPIPDIKVLETFNKIKNKPESVNKTLRDYRKYIVGKRR
ncbi:hypothetical protein ACTFR8_23685 [Bacillus cereus group sp. MYBK15-3]|uniref:hypothetical protein n=1 Tax=Bacillus cereus group TaxID=86661 RepID=UPI001C8B4A26|nr:hypothetical protein [Bacillus cereus]MBX9158601.1 hypothetical protein [Bacillus cereus]